MRAFTVSEVELGKQALPRISLGQSLEDRTGLIEAGCTNQRSLIRSWGNPFISAVHTAFSEHLPLHLSPDDVWLCIAQGFAHHVTLSAESLRQRFVSHEGKLTLHADAPALVPGALQKDWAGVFEQISGQLAAHIGKARDLVVADFSTTGPVERAASQIVLMSAMQAYFAYECSLCGIPEISLLGTLDDWRSVRRRAEVLAEFNLQNWVAALIPVLDQFIAASQGSVDRSFWRSLYKVDNESGGPYISGWINVLFPYLRADIHGARTNSHALAWGRSPAVSMPPTTLDFPPGLSGAPVDFTEGTTRLNGAFFGGFVGVSQNTDTLAVRPAIGWAVTTTGHPEPPNSAF